MRHAQWMSDFESYHAALEADGTYAATLSRSLSLVLDEFYANMRSVGVSALTGEGMDEMMQAVEQAAADYEQFYVPELEARRKEKEAKERKAQQVGVWRTLAVLLLWCCSQSARRQSGGRAPRQATAILTEGWPMALARARAQKQMEAVRRDLAASKLGADSAADGSSSGGRQQQQPAAAPASSRQEGPQAGLGALAMGARGDEGEEDEGCDYEVSDDSIEDEEEAAARDESRAK